MKRVNNIFEKILTYENLEEAIDTVNKTHRTTSKGTPNKIVAAIEKDKDLYIEKLQYILQNNYIPKKPHMSHRYDKSACKWRDISEPVIWPDQYIHHALIQVLNKVMMRGMDYWCCGSIKRRGIKHGMSGIKKWMRDDKKNTSYCMELDIHHFYDSLNPQQVIFRMKELIKDRRTINLIVSIIHDGVLIGTYCSQWFANTILQPLDVIIRKSGFCKHYIRYMDNFTIFGPNKRKLHKLKKIIDNWLNEHQLSLKSNWQIFPTKYRLPSALGYRFGRGYTKLRKRNLLRIKRQLKKVIKKRMNHEVIAPSVAYSLMSRLGQLRHCSSVKFYHLYVPNRLQRFLKNIIRKYKRKEMLLWKK